MSVKVEVSVILVNVILGLVLPWTLAMFMVRRTEWYIVVSIGPFATALGYILDMLWSHQGYGHTLPKFEHHLNLSALPADGMFPVAVSLFVIATKRHNRVVPMVLMFSLMVTAYEKLGIILGKVVYLNGWSLLETYVTYIAGFTLNLWYWRLMERMRRDYV